MYTLHHIAHATDSVSKHITDVDASADDAPPLSPKEQAASIIAKNRVLKILNRSIRDVEYALQSSSSSASSSSSGSSDDGAVAMDVAANPDANRSPAEVIKDGMTGNSDSGLKSQVPSLSKMAEDTGPILDTFQSILSKPYLKNYNATIQTVPVIGLKGDNVMYTETKTGGHRGVEDVWSVFGRIPDGVNIDSSKAVHFFPYKGDFCMSVGKAIWRKRHRDDKDPEIKLAVNQWPKLYLDAWEKVGDSCLPVANARSVLPFARLAGKDIRFHLVILADDGRLLALDGDLSAANNKFSPLKNVSDPKKNASGLAMQIQQAAYFNGNIVAYDDKSNTWNLDVDFDTQTFNAKDPIPVDPMFELTATDGGPVCVKKDGYLYRRRVETVNDTSASAAPSEKGDKKVGWERWIQQAGVKNLGVASPGVMLDLETLTRSLRDRYLSTQTAIYPVVNKLQSFTINYQLFLQKQLEAAKQYEACQDAPTKQTLAVKEAKKLVTQTRIWAVLMGKQAAHTQTSVSLMTTQLQDVKTQLDKQLQLLQDKLVSLKAQIEALKEAKAKMDKAFWASIGVMLLGIGLAIIGTVTGVGVALAWVGGALFVGGLVAACYFGSKSAQLAGEIADRESEMSGVQTAMGEVRAVADMFGNLGDLFGTLSQFWGRMSNASTNLKDMNDATAAQLGASILEDTVSIEAGIKVVKEMKNGCATYLAVLNRAGIVIPGEDDTNEDEDEAADVEVSDAQVDVDVTFKSVALFNAQVHRANAALEKGDFAEYEKHLEAADLIDECTIQMGVAPEAIAAAVGDSEPREAADMVNILTSLALDPSANSAPSLGTETSGDTEKADIIGDIFGIVARTVVTPFLPAELNPFTMYYSGASSGGAALNGLLVEARGSVLGMVDKTLEMTDMTEGWVKQISDVPTSDADVTRFTELRRNALSSCKLAMDNARGANAAFVEFNHRARDEEARIRGRIVELTDKIRSLDAQCDAEISAARGFSVLDIVSFGINRAAIELKVASIKQAYSMEISLRMRDIGQLQQDLQVGQQIAGATGSWLKLCQDTSGNLGAIYNNLTAAHDGIKVDARLYKEFASTQWAEIRRSAEEVKKMLQPGAAFQNNGFAADTVVSGGSGATGVAEIAYPDAALVPLLRTQASGSTLIWNNIGKLGMLTYTDDMVAYYEKDASGSRAVTLAGVIGTVRRTYIQTASLHYQTVEHLSSLALMQSYRADALASGRISTHMFLKGTFLSVSLAGKQAASMRSAIAKLCPELQYELQLIKSSVTVLKKAIEDANLDLARRDKAYRDKVTGMLVEGCLTGFATGALVTAAAFAAYSGVAIASLPALLAFAGINAGGNGNSDDTTEKPAANGANAGAKPNGVQKSVLDPAKKAEAEGSTDKSDAGPDKTTKTSTETRDEKKPSTEISNQKRIAAAKDTWIAVSGIIRTAKDAAAATTLGRALFNKLSLAELLTLMQLVQAAVVTMERTVSAVETLAAPLEDQLKSAGTVADILDDMDEKCRQYQAGANSADGGFGKSEAAEVKDRWSEVAAACTAWLDVFNGQGISPLFFAVV